MQRVGNLWADVVSFEKLHRAFYQVLRGKRGKPGAGDLFMDLEGNLFRLQRELRQGRYVPGDSDTFWVHDPKARLISAAPLRDRVVHHALVNVIEPIFERRFIHHSYACRKGKGTHRALRQSVWWVRSSRYVLKMDSRKLFPTIDHEILKSRIRQVKEGIEFLGFVVFPDEMRLNQTAVRRQRRRIRRLRQEYAEGAIDWPKVKASLHAWNAHAAHGTAWRLRGNVFQKAVFSRLGPSQDAGTTGAEQAEALD